MKIGKIKELLSAEIICGEEHMDYDVHSACCSDMMSDVLAYVKDQAVLITGLVNPQVIRTANMMDMICVVFVRNKAPSEEMVDLAKECGLVLMKANLRAFEACGMLWEAGLSGKTEDKNV